MGRAACRSGLCGAQPHRHAGFQAFAAGHWIGTHEKAVEVVIADRARSAPGRELAKSTHLGYTRLDFRAAIRGESHARADGQAAQTILADGEAEPWLVGCAQSHDSLSRQDRLAGLRDEN